MGVPVYVYDYLGGPGYLTEANFSLAERNNFSGRGFEKKTSDELLKEIKEGYTGRRAAAALAEDRCGGLSVCQPV